MSPANMRLAQVKMTQPLTSDCIWRPNHGNVDDSPANMHTYHVPERSKWKLLCLECYSQQRLKSDGELV